MKKKQGNYDEKSNLERGEWMENSTQVSLFYRIYYILPGRHMEDSPWWWSEFLGQPTGNLQVCCL